MRSVKADSAASRGGGRWNQMKWSDLNHCVRRLQIRIAKATRDQDWRRVKALQRFLVNSFSAKVLAVKRVSENDGKRTPGVDGEIWTTPGAKLQAIQRLEHRGYRPQPLRRIYIPKRGSDKKRPLGIPTMIDRAQQALHLLGLEPVAETCADPNSYGFRRHRSVHDAIARAFILLAKRGAAPWILEGDIKGCFDNFSHAWLESHAVMDKKVLSGWLKAGYVESGKLFPTTAGTPQGGIASPTLANIALDGLEAALQERFTPTGYATRKLRVRLARYADDFIITGSSKELLKQEVKPFVADFLAQRGLELSLEKTRVTHISEGFDFLGQNVRKYNGKLLIKPSTKNVKAFLDKVRDTIKANRSQKQETLIGLLNPMIRGWANYHQHVVAKATYSAVDHHIWEALWRWARRRHPMKSAGWVRQRYFRTQGHRHWVFATDARGYAGDRRTVALLNAAATPIVRHVKIQSKANPFDPAWEHYYAQRKSARMLQRLQGRPFYKRLWQEQAGICPGCGHLIEDDERWCVVPIIPFEDGGTRSLPNLRMLHPSCRHRFRVADKQPRHRDNRVPAPRERGFFRT